MTATTPIPTAAEPPLMDHTVEADPADPKPTPPPAAAVRPTLRAQVAENPLASFLGAVIVALLVSMLTTTNIRINRLEDRIDRLEEKIEARFAAQDAKIDALDAKFDEMNLKLTALIAALNATDAVDNAIDGRLADRSGDPAPDPSSSGVN